MERTGAGAGRVELFGVLIAVVAFRRRERRAVVPFRRLERWERRAWFSPLSWLAHPAFGLPPGMDHGRRVALAGLLVPAREFFRVGPARRLGPA